MRYLQRLLGRRKTAQALAQRARMVLTAADGMSNQGIVAMTVCRELYTVGPCIAWVHTQGMSPVM